MSDDSCGSSAPLKSFGALADRDRSHHQDRRPGASQGDPFRSTLAPPNLDGEFNAFLQGNPSLGPVNGYMAGPPTFNGIAGQGAYGPAGRSAIQSTGPAPLDLENPHERAWIEQFAAMNVARDRNYLSNRRLAHSGNTWTAVPTSAHTFVPYNNVGSMAPAGYVAPGAFGPAGVGVGPVHSLPAIPNQATAVATPQGPPAAGFQAIQDLTAEDLDAKFAQFQAEFENGQDFEEEMNAWMSQHGPNAVQNTTQDATQDITQNAEVDDVDVHVADGVENSNSAAEQKDNDPDALAQTAHDILQSVANNNSQKFQRSSFFELMRRIKIGDVVLDGDDLVDKETGQPVVAAENKEEKSDESSSSAQEAKAESDEAATETPADL